MSHTILDEVVTMRPVEESQARHEKHLADLATQNAPARSCNSGEGKDRTNTDQEEGTAMTSMTETPVSTKETVQMNLAQAVAFTQRIAGHLRASLRRAGHDVSVPDNPTVDELADACELLGVRVADFVAQIDAMTCPAWCSSHPALEPGTHVGEVTVGDVVLGLCLEPGEDVTVHLPDDVEGGLTPTQASALGEALTKVAQLTEEAK